MGHREHWSRACLGLDGPARPRASGAQPAPASACPARSAHCAAPLPGAHPQQVEVACTTSLCALVGLLSQVLSVPQLLGEQAPGACWGSGWPLLYGGPDPQAKA